MAVPCPYNLSHSFFKLVSDNFQYLVCMLRAKKMPNPEYLLFAANELALMRYAIANASYVNLKNLYLVILL
ncbi:hypothetical protein NIES2107_04260 [Nostoc carneum NIES-2107]|nr:hypothetical protein NIES2107_04260 [Nostoc carneum NIES-2107]